MLGRILDAAAPGNAGSELRKNLLHHHAVFQHIADAGGRAGVVLQHAELAGGVAHEVGADHVDVLPARRLEADHFLAKTLRLQHEFRWDHALLEDVLVVRDAVQE